jgi:hypothetical protein
LALGEDSDDDDWTDDEEVRRRFGCIRSVWVAGEGKGNGGLIPRECGCLGRNGNDRLIYW